MQWQWESTVRVWSRWRGRMDQHRRTSRNIISGPLKLCVCVHMLCLSACLHSFCSAPNIITLQRHAVYSSTCLGIRYENSLSIWVSMCEGHREKQKRMCEWKWKSPSSGCADEDKLWGRVIQSYYYYYRCVCTQRNQRRDMIIFITTCELTLPTTQ